MLGSLFGRSRKIARSPELGELGTHAFRVTDWTPNADTSWRAVNRADMPQEAARRGYSTHGPVVFRSDQNIPVFQGEKANAPAQAGDVTSAAAYLETFADAMRSTGYPS